MWFAAEELSEEDQQLKSELEMLVERLKVRGTRDCTHYSNSFDRKAIRSYTNQLLKL